MDKNNSVETDKTKHQNQRQTTKIQRDNTYEKDDVSRWEKWMNYIKNEKLEFDIKNKIYFNSKFSYEEKLYQGIKIDSSEYIFYNNKWYEFNNKKGKILCEM